MIEKQILEMEEETEKNLKVTSLLLSSENNRQPQKFCMIM